MPAKNIPLRSTRPKKPDPVERYKELLERNRLMQEVISALQKQQKKNAEEARALLMKYDEVAKIHKKRR